MARYAENTKVSVESSRGELSGILTKHGVQRQGFTSEPHADSMFFELGGQSYRITMTKPTTAELEKRDGRQYVYPHNVDWAGKVDQEWRRRWRAAVLLLKAKLEFIDSGDTTLDRELMAYRVLADGRTLEEALIEDGNHLLTAGRG